MIVLHYYDQELIQDFWLGGGDNICLSVRYDVIVLAILILMV